MKISNNHLAPLIQCICFSSSQQSIEWHCGWPWSCTGWNVWSFWNYYFTGLSFHAFHVVEYNETQVSYCISNCSKVVVAVVNSYISSKTLLLDSVMAVMSQQSIESLLTSGIRLVKKMKTCGLEYIFIGLLYLPENITPNLMLSIAS